MATGRRISTGPGTSGLVTLGAGSVVAPDTFDGGGRDGPITERPVPLRSDAAREVWRARIIAAADLGIGEAVRVEWRRPIERLRVIQRTASVTLALGYGRQPSQADFDDLVVGALYFDFPIPVTMEVTVLNIGGVALTDDLLVIGMAGDRYAGV